ncbi:uncharacterized protein APUU_31351S [Aspergillus puulaauensis]|uniref:Uncharacterized protein n=1 Tax=Aspergillus puulaauensis TaxID=1220207 RepID=A0A7R8ALB6_9EURO|nr:uncharacterized protein APUU_31351S [Aspergillus puulaauensis]BCS23126.1 hypothetical protein APUU_31351S [Aspergillus puulaauensis]
MTHTSETIWESLPRYPVPDELEKALAAPETQKAEDNASTALLNAAMKADPEAFAAAADKLFSSEPNIHILTPIMKATAIALSGVRKEVNHDTRVDCHILGKDLLRRVMDWKTGKEREVVLHHALTIAALTGNVDIAQGILAEDNAVAFHEIPIYAAVKAAAIPEKKGNAEVVLARLVASLCDREHKEDVAYVASLLGLGLGLGLGLEREPANDIVGAHVEAHKASIITEALEINRQIGWNEEVAAILMPAYRKFVGEGVEVDLARLTDAFEEKVMDVYLNWSVTQCQTILNDRSLASGNGTPKVLRTSIKRRIRAGVAMEKDKGTNSAQTVREDKRES